VIFFCLTPYLFDNMMVVSYEIFFFSPIGQKVLWSRKFFLAILNELTYLVF